MTGPSFWERTRIGWHVTEYALLGVVAVGIVVERPDVSAWRGLAAVVASGVVYAFVGRRALGADRLGLALGYLVPAWLCFAVIVTMTGAGYLLLVLLFPQSWAMLPSRRSAIVVNVVTVLGLVVLQVRMGGELTAAVLFGAVQLALTLLLGLWISGVIEESGRRACLIAELERTRADLAATEHARGVLAERERLAREIHDTLAQGLTSILTLASAADAALDRDRGLARSRLALLESTARDNLAEARALVAAFGPVDLEQSTLAEAVARLGQRFTAETGIPVDLEVVGAATLRTNAEVVLVRAAQEALANVRRHAGASRVRMRLVTGPDGAQLTVADDGRGLADGGDEGLGLRGMRAHATQVGGAVDVSAAPGGGTTVRVSVP